jgi:hypothetical protein
MVARYEVLLTPLESFQPRPLPSSHRINRVHPAFCKKTTFLFSCTSRMPISQLLSFQFHAGMGGWGGTSLNQQILQAKSSAPFFIPAVLLSLLEATLTRMPISVDFKGFTGTLNPLDATLTKNWGAHHSSQSLFISLRALCVSGFLTARPARPAPKDGPCRDRPRWWL